MKRNMVVGIAMALGIISTGTVTSFASEFYSKCADKQAVEQFRYETNGLVSKVKQKDLELRELNAYDGIDINKVNALEADIKDLKEKINASANKYGVYSCGDN